MHSETRLGFTRTRARALLRGAELFRAFSDMSEDVRGGKAAKERARMKWRAWLNHFEPRLERQNIVYGAVTTISGRAYELSIRLAASDPDA